MGNEEGWRLLKKAVFRIYGDLNLLVETVKPSREVTVTFRGRQTTKHLIESLGVPHTEIGLILAGGEAVDFGYIPCGGERLAVFPYFERFDFLPLENYQPPFSGKPRFALDGHLGRLAAYLRMLGFDAIYRNHIDDEELAKMAARENRILLTRDRGLLKRKEITLGCCLLSLEPRQQLVQVARRYGLRDYMEPFTRCMACNGPLLPAPKAEIFPWLEPKTRKYFNDFKRCAECGKVYWAGSHHKRMLELIAWLQRQLDNPDEESPGI